MLKLIAKWLLSASALLFVAYIYGGVQVRGFGSAMLAALVIGLLNIVVRPVLVVLTLPVTVVSLGLFILVINALLFWLVAHLVGGFHVAGFWSAFLAAILYSVISWALSTLLLNKDGNP